jgi:group I intron endonuclease
VVRSEETRAKMSEAHIGLQSGENNPMYGRTHTPESKAKMSVSISGANNPMYGRTHTPETLVKISEAMSGKVAANAMTIYIYSLNGTLINSFWDPFASCSC